jgi:hypothetical protein
VALSVNERVGFLIEALQEGRSSCSWADSGRGKKEVSDSEANCFKPPKLRPANQEKNEKNNISVLLRSVQ